MTYEFSTRDFSLEEQPDTFTANCDFCEYRAVFPAGTSTGAIGTDLLLHRLRCRNRDPQSSGYAFAADTWQPKIEGWSDYERRVTVAFEEGLREYKRGRAA